MSDRNRSPLRRDPGAGGPIPPGFLRALGLVLLVAIILGALAVRFLGGRGGPVPSLYDAPDTTISLPRDSGTPAPAATDAAGPAAAAEAGQAPDRMPDPDTALDLSLRGFPAVAGAEPGPGTLEPEPIYVPPTPPEGWADAAVPSPWTETPMPDSLRIPRPDVVRGIYIGSWSAGSRRRLPELVALAEATELNAFVIDVKDATGEVSYETAVPLALQLEASRRIRIPDVRAMLDTLRAHGIYPIARIVAFKDPVLAAARPDWSVEQLDGSPWVDDNGVRWVDSFNRSVWDYNIELAREAAALGFGEIQWDYVRFPDVPDSYELEAIYPARDGRTMIEGIREFLGYARERLAGLDVPITADVFGITASAERDVGIGQDWEAMSDRVDVLLPMVYPSHYPPGSWDYPNPNAAPYQVVRQALDDAVARSRRIRGAAAIRPWLQAFTLGDPDYGPRHIRAQIDAVYDAGLDEWLLWHPRVDYPEEAFVDANGIAPWFAGMGEALYQPEPASGQPHQPDQLERVGGSRDTVP